MDSTTFVGLDVHADSITAAIVHGQSQEVEVIELSSDLMKVRRLFRRLSDKGPVRACYEASGAGFVLQRVLSRDGFHCDVIAPSLIPCRPGDRRKTDRLDAIMLARLYRRGHLTPVHVPTEGVKTFAYRSSSLLVVVSFSERVFANIEESACSTGSELGRQNLPCSVFNCT